MARRHARPAATRQQTLEPARTSCAHCGTTAHVAYHSRYTVSTLDGLYGLILVMRRCQNVACPR